jgi:ABC-type amino acid transport substrate-binding protein
MVASGRIDFVMGAMSRTSERATLYGEFSGKRAR